MNKEDMRRTGEECGFVHISVLLEKYMKDLEEKHIAEIQKQSKEKGGKGK